MNWDDPIWRAFQKARQRWMLEFAKQCTATAKAARPGVTCQHQFSTIFHNWTLGAPLELVMPPFTAVDAAYGMTLYSLKAVLHGQGGEVFELIRENFPKLG